MALVWSVPFGIKCSPSIMSPRLTVPIHRPSSRLGAQVHLRWLARMSRTLLLGFMKACQDLGCGDALSAHSRSVMRQLIMSSVVTALAACNRIRMGSHMKAPAVGLAAFEHMSQGIWCSLSPYRLPGLMLSDSSTVKKFKLQGSVSHGLDKLGQWLHPTAHCHTQQPQRPHEYAQ